MTYPVWMEVFVSEGIEVPVWQTHEFVINPGEFQRRVWHQQLLSYNNFAIGLKYQTKKLIATECYQHKIILLM